MINLRTINRKIMVNLRLKLHQSLRVEKEPFEFEGEFESGTLIENIRDLLKNSPTISDLCLSDRGRKPGILYLSGRTELSSLGLLEELMDEDIELRIVPILHGG